MPGQYEKRYVMVTFARRYRYSPYLQDADKRNWRGSLETEAFPAHIARVRATLTYLIRSGLPSPFQ